MNKKLVLSSILMVLVVACLALSFTIGSKDALKFKEEYENLNDTIRESDGAKYNSIDISRNNPIKYINIKETLNILKNDTGVLYVGANWCPWCRNAIPVLFEAAKSSKVKTVYYLNIDNEKDTFEVRDGELVKTKEGSKEYYELLEVLKGELEDYVITSGDKTYNTEEKRIYMPFVVFFKDGKIVDSKTGTVSLNEGQTKYDALTKEQYNKLLEEYKEMFKKIK